ncbi:hypothetical protein N7486_006300 [Penicillium sp. IBT 16267x]|nr:hypothetical protein N7486_006300 [Penicillium sp. IBT 16267x]
MASIGAKLRFMVTVGVGFFADGYLNLTIGLDYPLSSSLAAENSPFGSRAIQVLTVFSNIGLGNFAASIVFLVLLKAFESSIADNIHHLEWVWRLLFGIGIIPALFTLYARLTIAETLPYKQCQLPPPKMLRPRLTSEQIDIAYYGINLNQSIILAKIGYAKGATPWETLYKTAIGNIIVQTAGYLPGFYVGIFLPDRIGRVRQQLYSCGIQSSDTWVFWVHASTAARCEESLRNLADRAKIPGREDRNVHIFQLFGNWLQDGNIGEWILVLDNVDDDELLRKPLATRTDAQANAQNHTSTQPPLRYLLEASNGSIIITSRNKAVASEIAGHKKNLIDVQPMNMAEALDLMQHKLDSCVERADLVQLVEELEFMPLAIVQAASYIAHRSPRCSASQYLEKLRQSDRQATKLLNHEGLHTDRDWEAKNSILLTWQISFDHIRRIRQSAADLLSLMSFFDWQGIPEDLLRVQDMATNHEALDSSGEFTNSSSGEDTESSSEYDLDDNFESDIITLRDYSFVATSENSMVFTMHRLVQLTVRTWLKTYGQDEDWKERFIKNLHAEFPTGQYEHWERCRTLFPHVKSAMSHRPKSQDCLQSWAGLLYKGAWYARECGNIPDSREMASMSREQRIKILGLEDEETLNSTAMLAVAYRLEGGWREAEQLEVQVMETRKTKLGVDHPDTLTSMANLASTFWDQGRWEEAEQLEVQVMETSKTKLGVDHPDTLTSMANLASTFWDQGRWEEAEQLDVQVMETRKTKLGVDHPDTLTSMNNLAHTLRSSGQYTAALQLMAECVQLRDRKLGPNHPRTTSSKSALNEWRGKVDSPSS